MVSEGALETRDIRAGYDGRPVLRGISLSAGPGELVGLVGRNGCGKTTLLRVITRVVTLTEGSVRLLGDDWRTLSPAELARRVAVVPQNATFPDGFTAAQVVLMGRTPHLRLLQSEGPGDLAVARRALEQTDALDLAHRPADQLSGGERQRVAIARALAQEAPILLLDEPTAHLDVGHQVAVMDLVRDLARRQRLAVVAAMHDLTLASLYCDRLVLMDGGVALAEGTPAEVLRPHLLERAYSARVAVLTHPTNGRPVVVPLDAESADRLSGEPDGASALRSHG